MGLLEVNNMINKLVLNYTDTVFKFILQQADAIIQEDEAEGEAERSRRRGN